MELAAAIKVTSDGSHRVMHPDQTYERARQVLEHIGITDICDLTGNDKLALPVWSVQLSKGADSNRVVAYGKGVSSLESQVSAMMEAIEHYSAQHLPNSVRQATYREMQQWVDVLDIDTIARGTQSILLENVVLEWLPGTDLFTGREIWVPAQFVLLRPTLNGHLLSKSSSNGLAAGNVIEEAVCHALCELIERDAWTLAWLRMITIPYIRLIAHNMVHSLKIQSSDTVAAADLYPDIAAESVPSDVRQIIAQFEHAGIALFIRNITSDIGIPTFLAASQGAIDTNNWDIHYGTGSHPNRQIAITRAITECAQSRLVAIRDFEGNTTQKESSIAMDLYQQNIFLPSQNMKQDFSSISSYENRDILDDIHCMLLQLERVGLQQVIAVNITLPETDLPVVRILIPGIEDWSVFRFSAQHCMLGPRGRRYTSPTHY